MGENAGPLLKAMEEAARTAGEFQLSEFRRRGPGWGDSKGSHDFVSFVDLESENRIRRILREALPRAAFYGEETEQSLGEEATWVVDPLDGTTNYLSGFEFWSVSIALWDQAGPSLGLVYKPVGEELFTARRDAGAFRNGVRLPFAEALSPRGALIATGTPYRSPDTGECFFAAVREVLKHCRDIRRNGSAALDLCYLAAGYFQGFWEVDLQPYDVAAGLLMLRETGHPCRTFSGAPYNPFKHRGLVSARPGVMEALEQAVRAGYQGVPWN
ncbi:MAG: inositol monophosphatase [Spirochaetaceae bacterium]|nr:inositol monophosphatase [Spirochaetaceae bacterium]